MQRRPPGASSLIRPGGRHIRATIDQQTRGLDLVSEEGRVERSHGQTMARDAIDVRALIDEPAHHLDVSEMRGESDRRKALGRVRVEEIGLPGERALHACQVADRRRLMEVGPTPASSHRSRQCIVAAVDSRMISAVLPIGSRATSSRGSAFSSA